MSIPPLVCSTPPPPDQCEDDKDPDDFDLHYNLSQDEDYDYGSYSMYNNFQSAISETKEFQSPINKVANNNLNNVDQIERDENKTDPELLQAPKTTTEVKLDQYDREPELFDMNLNNQEELNIKNKINIDSDVNLENRINHEVEVNIEEKIVNEEELNVEDLNLTVKKDQSLGSNVKHELDPQTDCDKVDSLDKNKEAHIPDIPISVTGDIDPNEIVSPVTDIAVAISATSNIEEPNPTEHQDTGLDDRSTFSDMIGAHPKLNLNDSVAMHVSEVGNEIKSETDDEFGDFNDFHMLADNKASAVVTSSENPWENTHPDSDLGAFEAHFDTEEPLKSPIFQSFEEKNTSNTQNKNDNDGDEDDFGEFDDFKSSFQKNKDTAVTQDPLSRDSRVPVLDLQTSDSESQVLENINKILNPIFVEDVPEPEVVFEGKLETLLCETWGHLLETDVRQPYIVNWNSSFAQKTLLKALCIDSRNILFGHKWSNSMPKYAANLSVAPLQPQKQSTPSGSFQSETNPDKSSAKVPSTWADPFTTDGQEFTYAEALLLDLEHLMATLDQMAHNHSNLKISELLSHACNKENAVTQNRPNDLNAFDPASAAKPDKIYSSTLSVQPLRQISLPDTHIFTPTDSETPRSKTIHYNDPTVFLSQSSTESENISSEQVPSDFPSNADSKGLDDGDYSDFQDFKGSCGVSVTGINLASVPSLNNVELPSNTHQLQSSNVTRSIGILQPIKIEPTMPTLNWPSPGEVKETFDDFSEFASHSTWNNEAQEMKTSSIDVDKTQLTLPTMKLTTVNTDIKASRCDVNNDNFDDDFDTFQSALPIKTEIPIIPSNSSSGNLEASNFSQNVWSQSSPNQEGDSAFAFSNKSDTISVTRPNDIFKYSEPSIQTNIENMPRVKDSIAKLPAPRLPKTQNMVGNVLQPIVSSPQTQTNTAQILQPLSLESFSQINWPNPGINLQDLSRFNPVETLHSLKSELSVSGNSKGGSPAHTQKCSVKGQLSEDDIWGEFISSKPKPQQPLPKKAASFVDDDEWTDFVSSPSVKPQNGLNTISLNVHTNSNIATKQNKLTNQALEIPTLNIITPKSTNHSSYSDRHFQNL